VKDILTVRNIKKIARMASETRIPPIEINGEKFFVFFVGENHPILKEGIYKASVSDCEIVSHEA
jgi:hypothetical protein